MFRLDEKVRLPSPILTLSTLGPTVTTALSTGTPSAVAKGGLKTIAVGVLPPVVLITLYVLVDPATVNVLPMGMALEKPSTVMDVSPSAGAVTDWLMAPVAEYPSLM